MLDRIFATDKRVEPTWPVSTDPLGREVHRFNGKWASLEYMIEGDPELRPLVILQSLDVSCWPTVHFCQMAQAAGFRVISVRRPGFGGNPSLTDKAGQCELVRDFLARRKVVGRSVSLLVSALTVTPS